MGGGSFSFTYTVEKSCDCKIKGGGICKFLSFLPFNFHTPMHSFKKEEEFFLLFENSQSATRVMFLLY